MGRIETIGSATLYLGDCREIIPTIEGVDAVVTDPPYGITQNPWDCAVPLAELWPLIWKCTKDTAAVVMSAAQPFTATLVASQLQEFRYCWIWQKSRPTGHMNAKKRPLREHEDICVFYRRQPTYNPQFTQGAPNHVSPGPKRNSPSNNYGNQYGYVGQRTDRKYPKTILPFDIVSATHVAHPTQKPIALMSYMIRTYSDQHELVLDPFMGSGTTGVAAVKLGRRFTGVEIDPNYFAIACRRIQAAVDAPDLFVEPPAPATQMTWDNMRTKPFDFSTQTRQLHEIRDAPPDDGSRGDRDH
jgi:DNA modification methylase